MSMMESMKPCKSSSMSKRLRSSSTAGNPKKARISQRESPKLSNQIPDLPAKTSRTDNFKHRDRDSSSKSNKMGSSRSSSSRHRHKSSESSVNFSMNTRRSSTTATVPKTTGSQRPKPKHSNQSPDLETDSVTNSHRRSDSVKRGASRRHNSQSSKSSVDVSMNKSSVGTSTKSEFYRSKSKASSQIQKSRSKTDSKHKTKHTRDSTNTSNKLNSPRRSPHRRRPHSDQTSKITTWLTPPVAVEKSDKAKARNNNNNNKLPQLDITINKQPARRTGVKSIRGFNGIIVPSYQEILANHKKFDADKQSVKRLEAFDNAVVDSPFTVTALVDDNSFNESEVLDCKQLSLAEIDGYFEKYVGVLQEISTGKRFSARHERFVNSDKELTYSTSTIVFSQEQNERMLDLMEKRFDLEDKLTNYFFKVLLPEFCLLVFMEVHNMTEMRAVNYLDKRPLEAV